MFDPRFVKQVDLLLRVLPLIDACDRFAMHGGTAINLFVHDLPRLSVDIDLTYMPASPREEALADIRARLQWVRSMILKGIPGASVAGPDDAGLEFKLLCRKGNAQVKIEVNTIMRGLIGEVERRSLCPAGSKEFRMFCEMRVVPLSQLFGGKVCAALDRQHPRDLFDVRLRMNRETELHRIKTGLIYARLSSNRPLHELLAPRFSDQVSAFNNQFRGMSRVPFSYTDFEETRERLMLALRSLFTDSDKRFILSFMLGDPDWSEHDLSALPSIRWKLENLNAFRVRSPGQFQRQMTELEQVLARS